MKVSLSGSAPKSLQVVGFTRTKSPGFLSIKWFNITAAYHVNIITIEAHSASIKGEIELMWDNLQPLAKVKYGEGHLGAANSKQSHTWWQERPSIDVLAPTERQDISRSVVTTPSVAHARPANRAVPASPAPFSLERTTLLHSVIPWLLRLGSVFCHATLHLKEKEAAEMCTADGRNYLAHLTSEIFFPPFSSLSPFSTNYSKTGEIDRFLVHVGFWVVHGRLWVFQISQLWYQFSQLHQFVCKWTLKTSKLEKGDHNSVYS